MSEIDGILREMKKAEEAARPVGLARGLSLKLHGQAGGLWQLVAWREGTPPALAEVAVLVEAIKRLDNPALVLHSSLQETGRGRYYYRIWWWEEAAAVTVSWLRPSQGTLLDEQTKHNYMD